MSNRIMQVRIPTAARRSDGRGLACDAALRIGFLVVFIILAAVAAFAAPATRAAGAPTTKPVDEAANARRLIIELDSANAQVRRNASVQLNSLGADAAPVIEAAIKDGSAGPEGLRRLEAAARYVRPRALMRDYHKRISDWEMRTLHEAYDKGGFADGAWDAAAHRAIDQHVTIGINPAAGPAGPRERVLKVFREAVDKGCKDPLILCLYHLSAGDSERPAGKNPLFSFMAEDMKALNESEKHPAFAKFWVTLRYLCQSRRSHEISGETLAKLFEQVAATEGMPPGEPDVLITPYYMMLKANGEDAVERNFSPMLKAFEKAPTATAGGPAFMKGQLLADRAFAARGRGDRKAFRDRLTEAESAMEEAWKRGPDDKRAPNLMLALKIELAGSGDAAGQEEMEKWFRRAMEADPDNEDACQMRLAGLSPRNGGSTKEMIAFGRECLETQNFRTVIPFIIIDAHLAAADESGDVKAYFERPDVWEDVRTVYEGSLASFPDDDFRRSHYAKLAGQCGKWDVAQRLFERLGDRAEIRAFGSKTALDFYKKKAARLGQPTTAASQPAATNP